MYSNPFACKPLRCVYDEISEKWWFSAVDICAILLDVGYETGRIYWKDLKYSRTIRKNQAVINYDRLKLPGKDGKFYFSEVFDTKGVVYLIMTTPSPNAEPFRLWLAEMIATNSPIEPHLVAAGEEYAKKIMEKYKKTPQKFNNRQCITRRVLV